MVALFDRRAKLRPRPRSSGAFSGLVSRLATRAPRTCLAIFAAVTVLSLVPLARYLRDPFEYDFRNLRNRRSVTSGSASLSPVVERVFGETLTPAVVLSDSRRHADEIRHKILERDRTLPGGPMIGRVAIFDAVDPSLLFPFVPVVGDDARTRGEAARRKRSVPWRGDGVRVSVVSLGKNHPPLQKKEEPALERRTEALQILRPALIDAQKNQEPRRRGLSEEGAGAEEGGGREHELHETTAYAIQGHPCQMSPHRLT